MSKLHSSALADGRLKNATLKASDSKEALKSCSQLRNVAEEALFEAVSQFMDGHDSKFDEYQQKIIKSYHGFTIANENYKEAQQTAIRAEERFLQTTARAVECSKNYRAAHNPISRKIERAKALAAADRAAYEAVWPELSPKLLNSEDFSKTSIKSAEDDAISTFEPSQNEQPILPRAHFLALMRAGARPALPWGEKILPDILEEMLGFAKPLDEMKSDESKAAAEIIPPLMPDEVAEQRGRALLAKVDVKAIGEMSDQKMSADDDDQSTSEFDSLERTSKTSDGVARHAEPDFIGITAEEYTARLDARELIDDLEDALKNQREEKIRERSGSIASIGSIESRFTTTDYTTEGSSSLSETAFIHDAHKEIEDAEKAWEAIIEKSEAVRRASGLDSRSIEDWKIRDQEAVTERNWNTDVARCVARAKADRRQDNLNFALNNKTSSAEIRTLQQEAQTAETDWELKADLHKTVRDAEPDRKKKAKTLLLDADRAVNRVRSSLLAMYQGAPTRDLTTSGSDEEPYQNVLLAWRAIYSDAYFKNPNDKAARANYTKAATAEALRALQQEVPRAVNIWWERYLETRAEAQQANAAFEQDLKKGLLNEEKKRAAKKLISLARSEKKAHEAAEKEFARLEGIRKTWMQKIEEADQATKLQIEAAAKDHYDGKVVAWHALSDELKMAYNKVSEAFNESYEQKYAEERAVISSAEVNCILKHYHLQSSRFVLNKKAKLEEA